MKNNEKILLGTACFFAGAVMGFLIAPIKKGIYCGNNSGNNYLGKEEDIEKENVEREEVLDEITRELEEIAEVENEKVID